MVREKYQKKLKEELKNREEQYLHKFSKGPH
jgi:hypothetical protein